MSSQPDNKQLSVWWARFCESRGDIKRALACYEKAADTLSVVRIHCATGNHAAAEDQVCHTHTHTHTRARARIHTHV